MSKRTLIALSVALLAAGAQAQNAPAPATPAPAAAPAAAPSSPAKKDLVARILRAQQPGIENMARNLAEQPAGEIMASAGQVLQTRVPRDKQDAVAKDIQADIQKYVEDAVPLVQKRALALAPSTVGALLEERFTEDELRQIVATLESPVFAKFQKAGEDMQRVLAEKLIPDTKPVVEPKIRNLENVVSRRLGLPPEGAAPAAPAARNGASGANRAPAKK